MKWNAILDFAEPMTCNMPGQDTGASDTELACVQPSETSFGWNLEDKH